MGLIDDFIALTDKVLEKHMFEVRYADHEGKIVCPKCNRVFIELCWMNNQGNCPANGCGHHIVVMRPLHKEAEHENEV